jgi:hypothetical protein
LAVSPFNTRPSRRPKPQKPPPQKASGVLFRPTLLTLPLEMNDVKRKIVAASLADVLTSFWMAKKKNKAAAALGKLGGLKRAKLKAWEKIAPERRKEIARKAVAVREANRKKEDES